MLVVGLVLTICFLNSIAPFNGDASQLYTVDTQTEPIAVEAGLGADQGPLIGEATSHIKERRLAEAGKTLDKVLTAFRSKITDSNTIYVSAATSVELETYRKENPSPGKIVWLDWSFREALHLKAFIEAASKRFQPALDFLDEEIKYAPTAAAPYVERAYIQNQQKNPKAALESYTQALALSRKYASSAGQEGPALRGMGVVLIDLGDLDRAEALLRQSLKVDPDSPVAANEIEYIRRLRATDAAR